ncbi:MAG: SufD family Fe-S cluster assembly protein [Fibrobacter sp.]|nr:SufD family Fe-S cluster assembly protein [Fibrobacter sp.]
MQKEALEKIRELGLPGKKVEDWYKFPTAKLGAYKSLEFIANKDIPVEIDDAANVERLSESGFQIADFEIEKENDISALLPLALGAKSFVKVVKAGASENGILKPHDEFSHTVFRIEKGAKVSLEILENKIERELSAERIDLFVEEDAEVELFSTEVGHANELKFRTIRVHQAKGSKVHILDLNRSDSLRRTSVEDYLEGEAADFGYRALNILRGSAAEHDFVRVSHQAPKCPSRQFIRNLLSETASVNYDGGVIAGANCPGTDSSELVNTILLSDDARIHVKPTLKIFHDDVACSHGNTVGSLDRESLYYLQSRGIDKKHAEELLIEAFAKDIIAEHPFEPGKQRLAKVLAETFLR